MPDGVEVAAQAEAPAESQRALLGVDRLRFPAAAPGCSCPRQEQRVALDMDVEPFDVHARQVRAERDALRVLEDVHGRLHE